jgi:DNA-binding NarL/FixJ family response regulator
MKIYLVEDSPHVCERLKELIAEKGQHTVIGCADTAATALEGIIANKPDVAVFDIQLKEGNGIDVLAAARRRLPHLLAIVLSNQPKARHDKASRDAGAAFVLDKSTDLDVLGTILASLSNDFAG